MARRTYTVSWVICVARVLSQTSCALLLAVVSAQKADGANKSCTKEGGTCFHDNACCGSMTCCTATGEYRYSPVQGTPDVVDQDA
ncbi:hypothetical protein BSKO_14076 [Bryopsis sp. KO-2023]|nr:hypothetical protein BSKO_14076 [Bryopsis sp. KO-2023]